MEKGFFGSLFDLDGDGQLNFMERTSDFMAFEEVTKAHEDVSENDEIDELDEE